MVRIRVGISGHLGGVLIATHIACEYARLKRL